MRNLKIFTKLFLSHAAVVLVAIVTLSVTFYLLISNALVQRTLDQLSSINFLKKELVETYLFKSKQNLEALQLESKFLKIYHDLDRHPTDEQQHQNADLIDIEHLCTFYDFKNLHVFDTRHHQLYSTDKEMYPEGLLKKIDSAIIIEPRRLHVIDASTYSPDKSTLLFYYVPILEKEKVIGIVLVQENFQKIQNILLETTGMGNTGESYLFGQDYRLRSTSRFFPDSIPGLIRVNPEAVRNSFHSELSNGIIVDYRGVSVLSSHRKIDNQDLQWIIASEIDEAEAMLPIYRLRNYFIGIIIFVIALVILITYYLSNIIVQPILHLKETILTLSKGIVPSNKHFKTNTHEIEQMGQAIYHLTEGFERTALFANEIGSGNFKAEFTTLSVQDTLGNALVRMRDELRNFHEKELKSARTRAAALLEGQENERRRIIKELHDGVGQMLTAIRMQVDILDDQRKDDIKTQINVAIAEVKRISYNVMPQSIIDYGLEAALKGLCDSVKKYSPITIDFRFIKEIEHTLNFEISIALFRIAQEGLNNIVKHANATHVDLHILDKEDEVYFILEDNGKGFDEKEKIHQAGSGLRNIKERAKLLNGSVDIHTALGMGTSIEVHIPIV